MSSFEEKRLQALRRLSILDTPTEARFDKITLAAKTIFKTKVALFTIIDHERQWFKSKHGLYIDETPRSVAFCDVAIRHSNIFVINDAAKHQMFKDNPLVVAKPNIRFYAGAPIREPRGFAIGTLCIIDDQPRDVTPADLEGLRLLADIIEHSLQNVSQPEKTTLALSGSPLDNAIKRAQTVFLTSDDVELAFNYVLQDLLELTHSRYGLIGEVKKDEEGARFIQIKSITNLSWNEASEALYQKMKGEGMFFRNQNNILGTPLKTGKIVVANDFENDNRKLNPPEGHPHLENYMGIPVFVADQLVALVGLANKDGGFKKSMSEEIQPLLNTVGNLIERTQLIQKNEEQKELLRIAANYDELTGLPNRRRLRAIFEKEQALAIKAGYSIAILFLDLDGFKEVNDRNGHSVGDAVLKRVAQRLQSVVRSQDTVARLGGDEFVVVLTQYNHPRILDRILGSLKDPIIHKNLAISISASIGATLFPENNSDLDTLLRHADQAMYVAKQEGKNRYKFFDITLHSKNKARL